MRVLACLAAVAALLAAPLVAQRPDATARRDYEERLRKWKIEAGQRHLELGVECRKKGLTTQAAEQIVLSVEVSEGLNPGATMVLSLMRRFEDDFWRKRAPKPNAGKLERSRRLEEEAIEARSPRRGVAGARNPGGERLPRAVALLLPAARTHTNPGSA
jgi:hypothetical protein